MLDGALTWSFKKRHPFLLQEDGNPRYFSCLGAIVSSLQRTDWDQAGRPENWYVKMLHMPNSYAIPYADLLRMRGMSKQELDVEVQAYAGLAATKH